MAVITQLDERRIASILAGFGLHRLHAFDSADEGIENTNYFVLASRDESDPAGRYVLTLLEEASPTAADPSQLCRVLEWARSAGLPVPELVRGDDGEVWVRDEGKRALLSKRIPGSHVAVATQHQCQQIGRFLGRFHRSADSLGEDWRPHDRGADWLRGLRAVVEQHLVPSDRAILGQQVGFAASMLERNDVRSLSCGLIHADLFRDNVLFQKGRLSGVIDFHCAASGYRLLDLAIALNDWCAAGVPFNEANAISLLRGYHMEIALGEEELMFLPGFLRYAALSFWLSRLAGEIKNSNGVHLPNKDPEEYRSVLIRHIRSPRHWTTKGLGSAEIDRPTSCHASG